MRWAVGALESTFGKKWKSRASMLRSFFPALFGRLHLRVNYRNHRKIAVIDGKVAYVGGFNIGKEYIGLDPKFGHWRDTHLRICGSAVGGLFAALYSGLGLCSERESV